MAEDKRRSRAGAGNPYRTVSASERRAQRRARKGIDQPTSAQPEPRAKPALTQEMINELLAHPTKEVTEEQLQASYSYVIADIRSMALLALGLIVFLVILANTLPR